MSTDLQAILNGPALAPPKGVTPQFVNPPNLNTLGFTVIGIFLALAVLAFAVRMYTKGRILRNVASEDCELS